MQIPGIQCAFSVKIAHQSGDGVSIQPLFFEKSPNHGGIIRRGLFVLAVRLCCIVRGNIPPDVSLIDGDYPIIHGIPDISLNDADISAGHGNNHPDMVGRPCAIPDSVILPIIKDIIPGIRHIGIIFHPNPHLFGKRNHLFATAFCRDDVRVPGGDGGGGCCRGAPRITIFYPVPPCKRGMPVVKVNNGLVASICFLFAGPSRENAYNFISRFSFCHDLVSSC